MTEKLYYTDSHQREFHGRVLSCAAEGGRWAVVLDRSCFFPGGGGQRPDGGSLSGVPVEDMREEGDVLVHLCAAPLPVGETVRGELDWETRFSRMQLHSGEHIVSGVAHALWGCDNVGFHMAPGCVTMDLDRELLPGEAEELERRANQAVWADTPFRCWFPEPEELSALDYRSKKELRGPVRLVEIRGVDCCACCAPHVQRSGEVGLIRLTDVMRHRGGARLTLKAGRSAWEEVFAQSAAAAELSALLSAPRGELVPALRRLREELDSARLALERAGRERMESAAAALAPTEGNVCFFDAAADGEALRAFVNAAAGKCRLCGAFSGRDGDWKYVIGSRAVDLRALAGELNAALEGRGGGSAEMIQGSCRADRAAIERYFAL